MSIDPWDVVFKLFKGKCLKCMVNDATQAHHIQPLSQGGKDDADNIAPLCTTCHDHITDTGHGNHREILKELRHNERHILRYKRR